MGYRLNLVVVVFVLEREFYDGLSCVVGFYEVSVKKFLLFEGVLKRWK